MKFGKKLEFITEIKEKIRKVKIYRYFIKKNITNLYYLVVNFIKKTNMANVNLNVSVFIPTMLKFI